MQESKDPSKPKITEKEISVNDLLKLFPNADKKIKEEILNFSLDSRTKIYKTYDIFETFSKIAETPKEYPLYDKKTGLMFSVPFGQHGNTTAILYALHNNISWTDFVSDETSYTDKWLYENYGWFLTGAYEDKNNIVKSAYYQASEKEEEIFSGRNVKNIKKYYE